MDKAAQVEAWKADLLADAAQAERQANEGPFYPDRGITAESLRQWAAECRAKAEEPERTLKEALGHRQPLPLEPVGHPARARFIGNIVAKRDA
jgi:hypothetical protein